MRKLTCLLTIFSTLLFFSCLRESTTKQPQIEVSATFLHLSHTRRDQNPMMDSVVEALDYSPYDMIWLGGDLTKSTSGNNKTMSYVDSIFDLGNKNTLWSLGNHDYADLNKIEEFTNRPSYYATQKDDLIVIVLDTQSNSSSIIDEQKDFLFGVLDTVQQSSHIVLLHHKLIWMYNNEVLEPQANTIANGGLGDYSYSINPNNFNSEIYPKLVELKQRGIEVLCVAGDIGRKVKEFEYITLEGIYFLASGIESGDQGNSALVFTYDQTNKILNWNFKFLNEL